jgi:hypothetical protein
MNQGVILEQAAQSRAESLVPTCIDCFQHYAERHGAIADPGKTLYSTQSRGGLSSRIAYVVGSDCDSGE